MKNPIQNEKQALILALQLAINAPDEEKAALATDCAERLAAGMTNEEVEACKALARAAYEKEANR